MFKTHRNDKFICRVGGGGGQILDCYQAATAATRRSRYGICVAGRGRQETGRVHRRRRAGRGVCHVIILIVLIVEANVRIGRCAAATTTATGHHYEHTIAGLYRIFN
jgi:hypothetical protein